MLKIRLAKIGKRHAPSYRIVVIPGGRPRDGRALETLGHFNPSVNPPTFSLDRERLEYWVKRGAQMSEAVERLAAGKYEFKPYRPRKSSSREKRPQSGRYGQGTAAEAGSQEKGGESDAKK